MASALSSALGAGNEQEVPFSRPGGFEERGLFLQEEIGAQQEKFFAEQELSTEHEGWEGYKVLNNQTATVRGRLSCSPPTERMSERKSREGPCSPRITPMVPHMKSEKLRHENAPVYVPPHRKVYPGRQRDPNWHDRSSRLGKQQPVQGNGRLGNQPLRLERTVHLNRSLPVDQECRRGWGSGGDRRNESRDDVTSMFEESQRGIRPLMAEIVDDRRGDKMKYEIEASRHFGKNTSVEQRRPGHRREEVASTGDKSEKKKSQEKRFSSEKFSLTEIKMKESSCIDIKPTVKESLESSLSVRKSSKETSGSEKKKSSGKKKGVSSRSQSPEHPPTLCSKSIEANRSINERKDRSYCSSSGYSYDRKVSKPVLRLKMPAKVIHRKDGKATDAHPGRDCRSGSCSSLVRTATGIHYISVTMSSPDINPGGLAHPSSCSSIDEKFPSLPHRLLSQSGSDATRNTWSGEELTASLDSLPSYDDSPHSSSWAEEVEEMQPSRSYASLFNSSFNSNSSPTLPRTPPTPWVLDAEESCCSEPDNFSTNSHSQPGYTICKKELSKGSVWDSHCHLDFLARKLRRENIKGGESLAKSLKSDGQHLGEMFGGCIANFCDPRDWAQGHHGQEVSKILSSCKNQSGVFLTLGCHPHFADKMDGTSVHQLQKLARKMKGCVVAIGECGLDKSGKNRVPMEVQKKYFEAQIDIARDLNLPLVMHIRGAEEEAKELLKKKNVPANFRIHYHCFTGTWKAAEAWLRAYPASKIGLTGLVTFGHAKSVREVARKIPLDKLLLETDAPYFLPSGVRKESYKHTFSQPGHVVHVAAQVNNSKKFNDINTTQSIYQVAALRPESLSEVLAANRKNIKDIYDC